MNKLLLSAAIALALTGCANPKHTWNSWDSSKKTAYVASTAAIAADWATTLDMTDRYHEGYRETNPVLGKQPDRNTVNSYFVFKILANTVAAERLPDPVDKWYLWFTTLGSLSVAKNNWDLGLRFGF